MTQTTALTKRVSADGIAVMPVATVFVVVLALAYMSTLAPAGMHTLFVMGDIDTVAALFVAGGLIFPLATAFACRMDHLIRPRAVDHFRQCSLLYAGIVLGALALVRASDSRGSVGYGVAGVVVVAALIGVSTNALTLAVRAIRARAI